VAADRLNYPKILEAALRDAVRRVLVEVAEHGLPSDHHFYVGFRTDAPGASLPRFLRERYPEEMTIVLQHQFWDLEVGDDEFSVSLSFDNAPQRLTVPFAALTAFMDPSAQFALRFDGGSEATEPAAPEEPAPPTPPQERQPGEVVRFDPSRRK